jgi:hypothetical protein
VDRKMHTSARCGRQKNSVKCEPQANKSADCGPTAQVRPTDVPLNKSRTDSDLWTRILDFLLGNNAKSFVSMRIRWKT